MACCSAMPSPRSKIPGTPWWCVEDLESVKKAVEQNNRSIEKLETSFTGFQKQYQHWCSSVHSRCASLEAVCEQLTGSSQCLLQPGNSQCLLQSGAQQPLREEQTARIDQLFEQLHQEHNRDAVEFNERLERLESKLDQSLSVAAGTVATTHAENTAEALDGTLAMLANIKGSLEQTHQAIAASCTDLQSREAIATTSTASTSFQTPTVIPACQTASQHERTKPSPLAPPRQSRPVSPRPYSPSVTPKAQRRASAGAHPKESSYGSCPTRPMDAVTPLKKRPSRQPSCQSFPTQPMRQLGRNTGRQSLGKIHSVASLQSQRFAKDPLGPLGESPALASGGNDPRSCMPGD